MLCQRESTILASTIEPRNLEELEGSLLDPRHTNNNCSMTSRNNSHPPTATAIPFEDEDASSNLIHATPVQVAASASASCASTRTGFGNSASPAEYFEYSRERLEQDQLLSSKVDMHDIPVAPTLTGYEDNSPEAQAVAASAKTRLGSDIGRVNAIEEKEKIRALSRQIQSKPYHEKARIETAGSVAKQRVREGFDAQVLQNSEKNSPRMQREVKKQDAAFVKKGGGDYDVSNYETSEYDCDKYDMGGYEYKSVYD